MRVSKLPLLLVALLALITPKLATAQFTDATLWVAPVTCGMITPPITTATFNCAFNTLDTNISDHYYALYPVVYQPAQTINFGALWVSMGIVDCSDCGTLELTPGTVTVTSASNLQVSHSSTAFPYLGNWVQTTHATGTAQAIDWLGNVYQLPVYVTSTIPFLVTRSCRFNLCTVTRTQPATGTPALSNSGTITISINTPQ